jgi:hypothetical protein
MAPIPGGGVKKLGEGVLLVCVDDALIEQQDKNFSSSRTYRPDRVYPPIFLDGKRPVCGIAFLLAERPFYGIDFFFAGRTSKKNTVWLRKSQLTP